MMIVVAGMRLGEERTRGLMGDKPTPRRVFISYSHDDEPFRKALERFLQPMVQDGSIALWSDEAIVPGDDWEEEIQREMSRADLVLLILTANFLASDYCTGVEMPAFFRRRQKEGLRVIPLLFSACLWQRHEWIPRVKMLPSPDRPVASWPRIEEALAVIATGIEAALDAPSTVVTRAPEVAPAGGDSQALTREAQRTAYELDRTSQWSRISSRCRSQDSCYFLLQGHHEQNVHNLLPRVRHHIVDEACDHVVAELDYVVEDDYPISVQQWTARLQAGLRKALGVPDNQPATAQSLLVAATRRKPLFLLIELRHELRFQARHQNALQKFLLSWLPENRPRDAEARPLRLLVAVDYDGDDDPEHRAVTIDTWFQDPALEEAGIKFEPLQVMTFPSWADVEDFLKRQRVKGEYLRAGHPIFDRIKLGYEDMQRRGDRRFSALVDLINRELYG